MFREITPPKSYRYGTGIKASLIKMSDNAARLNISIAADVIEEFGADEDKPFRFLVGSGENAGLVKVYQQADGKFHSTLSKGGTQRFNLGALPELPDRKVKSKWCSWKIVEKGKCIMITLPRWPSANSKAAQKFMTARRATNITAAAMGDPKNGRSALDQRAKH